MNEFELGQHLGAIAEQLKGMNARLDRGDERFDRIETTLAKTVQPQLAELMVFKGNVGKVVVAAGGIAMAAFGLVWQGITHYGSDLLALVMSFVQARRVS